MITGLLQKLIVLIIGLLFVLSAARIFFRAKNTSRTECLRIFKTAEYLNAWILLLCFVITMVYGVYLWRRRMSPTTQRVITRQLSWRIWFLLIIAIAAFSAAIGYGLARFTDDPTPYMDSFTTVVAIVAQVLMIMAYRDQWFLWFVVDVVSVVMWIYVGNYCMAAQYAFWCCNCIYGYIRWTQLST